MKALIIGKGAREHAMAWHLSQSPQITALWVAPGNAGTASLPKTHNLDVHPTNITRLTDFAKHNAIDFTLVGAEIALAEGIADAFYAENLTCLAPREFAAKLETDLCFAKTFITQQKIPSTPYHLFHNKESALAHIRKQAFPLVIKADVMRDLLPIFVANTFSEAERMIETLLPSQPQENMARRLIIEPFLTGYELSYDVLCDGKHFIAFPPVQTYRRLHEKDHGPITGGMGAYSPPHNMPPTLDHMIRTQIVQPTLTALRAKGYPYFGFLHFTLIVTPDNDCRVIDFNCRLGDPAAQVVLPRLQTNLATLCLAAIEQKLDQVEVCWDSRTAVCVIAASTGYPNQACPGETISQHCTPPAITPIKDESAFVFHAGTTTLNQQLTTTSGRVLAATALADNVANARQLAYNELAKYTWPSKYVRQDIAQIS